MTLRFHASTTGIILLPMSLDLTINQRRIDFEKGCYETRSCGVQISGKKTAKLLCRESKNTYEVMSKIYNDLEKQIGTVLSSAKSENTNHYLLSMNKNYQNETLSFKVLSI